MPGERSDSVLLESWYPNLTALNPDEKMDMVFWQTILEIRSAISKELEPLRADKTIGSSLDAEVSLYVDTELQVLLNSLQQELRFVLITSEARVETFEQADGSCIEASLESSGQTIKIKVSASENTKCVRCWHHREDVGQNEEHPELCGRCIENVAGDGEIRQFA